MKAALWIVGGLLAIDALFLSWFWVLRHEHYFPDRYEVAFVATGYAALFGLPLLGSFVTLLIIFLARARRFKTASPTGKLH